MNPPGASAPGGEHVGLHRRLPVRLKKRHSKETVGLALWGFFSHGSR